MMCKLYLNKAVIKYLILITECVGTHLNFVAQLYFPHPSPTLLSLLPGLRGAAKVGGRPQGRQGGW